MPHRFCVVEGGAREQLSVLDPQAVLPDVSSLSLIALICLNCFWSLFVSSQQLVARGKARRVDFAAAPTDQSLVRDSKA